jgi:predicted nuclease of predicted toxin-antitoxin system
MRNVLKFKIDENLPIEIVECLRQNNYDAFTVEEQGLNGSTDLNIAAVCRKEERIIVTLDTDFTNVRTYPPDEYSGIIVLRVKRQSRQHIINIFTQTVPLLTSEPIKHCLWIVEEHRLRIRGEHDKKT